VIIVLLAVIIGPPPVDIPPDPTVLEAYPRPDWYFLWIFAALALVPPGIEDLVILGMPLLIGTLLIALPFISSKGERSPKRRPWALAFSLVAVIMIGTLYVAGERAPWSPAFEAPPLDAAAIGPANQDVTAGAALFNEKGCQACHAVSGNGGNRGPDLTFAADRLTREQIIIRILNGGGGMPAYAGTLSPEELARLTAFMETRRAPPVAEK
jgi:ubiquinol-cytochrome c reductase cytochrome b subunit